MSASCPKCNLEGLEISIDQGIERGLPPLVMRTGAKAYECKKCEVVWGLLPTQGPLTEADVFGDLSDFKIPGSVVAPEQQDGGFTIRRQLEKVTKDVPAKDYMIELHNRLLDLRNRTEDASGQEYVDNLRFLAAKAHHKFDPHFLTPETVMRHDLKF